MLKMSICSRPKQGIPLKQNIITTLLTQWAMHKKNGLQVFLQAIEAVWYREGESNPQGLATGGF